jgi:hypothetical protein
MEISEFCSFKNVTQQEASRAGWLGISRKNNPNPNTNPNPSFTIIRGKYKQTKQRMRGKHRTNERMNDTNVNNNKGNKTKQTQETCNDNKLIII